jgi:hypothetical protein
MFAIRVDPVDNVNTLFFQPAVTTPWGRCVLLGSLESVDKLERIQGNIAVCDPIDPDRQQSVNIGTLRNMGRTVDPEGWYTARQTADLLAKEVTEATVKEYCKKSTVKCKKVGPKKRWMILGSSIIGLRRKWGLD